MRVIRPAVDCQPWGIKYGLKCKIVINMVTIFGICSTSVPVARRRILFFGLVSIQAVRISWPQGLSSVFPGLKD
jgi:hypothetical protein